MCISSYLVLQIAIRFLYFLCANRSFCYFNYSRMAIPAHYDLLITIKIGSTRIKQENIPCALFYFHFMPSLTKAKKQHTRRAWSEKFDSNWCACTHGESVLLSHCTALCPQVTANLSFLLPLYQNVFSNGNGNSSSSYCCCCGHMIWFV